MNQTATLAHPLPALPFADNALVPVISAITLGHHHGKHERGYLQTLNELIAGTEFEELSLPEIIAATAARRDQRKIFTNAAQAWNHAFYWQSLRPRGGGVPPAAIKSLVEASFGTMENCKAALAQAAVEHLGSGWVWLMHQGATLAVVATANADLPATPGGEPLLVIDVWEHAYYLDYQERRADHVKAVIDKLLNWGFAADNLGQRGPARGLTAP
jgi:Fe-Mn family superoxide dismutase